MSATVAFVGTHPFLGIGPEIEGDYAIAAATGDDVAVQLRAAGCPAVAADRHQSEQSGTRAAEGSETRSAAWVLEQPAVRHFLQQNRCEAILPFKPSDRLLAVADELGVTVLASAPRLVRQLENKLALVQIASEARVSVPPTYPLQLARRGAPVELPEAARDDFDNGRRLVFQPAMGFAGEGTQLVESADELSAALESYRGTAAKLVRHVEGTPLTINAAVSASGGVSVGGVTLQLTGLACCTARVFGSCGNDWTVPLDESVQRVCRDIASRVGGVLAGRGFRGVFGLDLVACGDGGVELIEINPRWTASLSLALQLEQLAGAPTLADHHLAAFGRAEAPADVAEPPRAGASLMLYNRAPDPVRAEEPLAAGVYRREGTALVRERDGYRLEHLRGDDEFLLFPPGKGLHAPGVLLARIVVHRRLSADLTGRTLLPEIDEMVGAVRARVGG